MLGMRERERGAWEAGDLMHNNVMTLAQHRHHLSNLAVRAPPRRPPAPPLGCVGAREPVAAAYLGLERSCLQQRLLVSRLTHLDTQLCDASTRFLARDFI